MPESFCRTPGQHCYFAFSVKFREVQCRFSSLDFSHAATVPLARCSPPGLPVRSSTHALGAFLASVAPWPACAGVYCSGRTTVAADREQNGGIMLFGTAQTPWWLRVAISSPAHACSTVAVVRHAQSMLPAADGPAPPSSVELPLSNQIPTWLAPKWNQETPTTTLNL